MIQKWGIGSDRIDLEAAREAGLVVAIAAGSNASRGTGRSAGRSRIPARTGSICPARLFPTAWWALAALFQMPAAPAIALAARRTAHEVAPVTVRAADARTVPEFRRLARRRLPRGLFEFIDRGTEDELALANNRAAFDRIRLQPRVLVDVSAVSTAAHILGVDVAAPIAIAPTGAAGLVWFRGELALAKAASAMNVPFTLATRSMSSIETIAEHAGGRLWFQLYPSSAAALELIARARSAGFQTLVVTVDTPRTPRRDYNVRNGFALPFRPGARALADMLAHPRWLAGVIGRYMRHDGLPRFENLHGRPRITEGAPAADMLHGVLDWARLGQLREAWPGRFVVKGVLHPDDAARAAQLGADAVVVSNHGGRNLDASVAPMDVLPQIVEAVRGKAEILLDGGIEKGSDIAKALALGASGVLVGRATLYGAAIAGEDGARQVIANLANELAYTMAMLGCPDLRSLRGGIVHRGAPGPGRGV